MESLKCWRGARSAENKGTREAIVQARTKDYAGPWLDGAPPVFYVGVNYDPATRGIDDPLVEKA